MQSLPLKTNVARTVFLSVLSLVSIWVFATIGIDTYEIYLNDKLLIRQAMNKPLHLQNLKLTQENAADMLFIRYNHCNAPNNGARGRSISLRDKGGNIIREWKFKDSQGVSNAMAIPVKELLEVQKNSGDMLTLYYSAEGLSQGQKLAAL